MALIENNTFCAGNKKYLGNPSTEGNIVSFGIKSSEGRFGFSLYNLINVSNQRVWSSGRNYKYSMGTNTPNHGYDI